MRFNPTACLTRVSAASLVLLSGCMFDAKDGTDSAAAEVTGVDVALATTQNAVKVFAAVSSLNEPFVTDLQATDITPASFTAALAPDVATVLITKQTDGSYVATVPASPGAVVSRDVNGLLLVCEKPAVADQAVAAITVSTPGWTLSALDKDSAEISGTYDEYYGCGANDTNQGKVIDTRVAEVKQVFDTGVNTVSVPGGVNYFSYAQAYQLTQGDRTQHVIVNTSRGVNGEQLVQVLLRTSTSVQ